MCALDFVGDKSPKWGGNGRKHRKQSSPSLPGGIWGGLHYGQQVRTGLSLISCLVLIFLSISNHPFPHRWTSSLPSVRVRLWAQLVSFSGATQCMLQVW